MYITTSGIVVLVVGICVISKAFNDKIERLEEELEDMEEQRNNAMMRVGNLMFKHGIEEE